MAQLARSHDHAAEAAPLSVSLPVVPQVIAVGDAPVAWSESPARALHEQLVRSFASVDQPDDRWPLRTRALVISAAVLAPWIAIGLAVAALA
jgi:hypothetical protein